jgi:DNA repair photolyase
VRKVDNPKNRFFESEIAWDDGEAPLASLHVHEEHAKSILSENKSPDISFRFSVNPYRGCQHACAYCYARPSHQYWGYGAGTDFEREIIVKVNAPALLREAFERPSWRGDVIAFSGNTDCYQPLEGRYRLTRALLSICAEYKNPVGVITKSALIQRDVDVLQQLARDARAVVFVSIPFADDATGRAIEPGAPAIHRRFETLAALSAAGIETGVAIAPLIVGLNDRDIPSILSRARQAGATRAFHTLLRLPAEVEPVFLSRAREALPGSADKIEHAVRDVRGGKLYDPRFGQRMRGQGPRWDAVTQLFSLELKRHGFNQTGRGAIADMQSASAPRAAAADAEPPTTFERPGAQLKLF